MKRENMSIEVDMVEQPENMSISLYPHQLSSIYMMEELEHDKKIEFENYTLETRIAMNADIVGYGKTLSMVGLVVRDRMDWDMKDMYRLKSYYTYGNALMRKSSVQSFQRLSTTLVLCSKMLVRQWKKEFSYTDLKVGCITSQREFEKTEPENYDVIITVPRMYNLLVESRSDKAWKRFIFDEPGTIRVPRMKDITAGFTWLVCATPNLIRENHCNCPKSYLLPLVTAVSWGHNHFYDLVVQNDEDFVRQSFKMPKTKHKYYSCRSTMYYLLRGIADDQIMDLVHANNIETLINVLNGHETSNVVDLIKEKYQQELQEIEAEIKIYQIRNDTKKIKKWTDMKERVQNKINDIEDRFSSMLNSNCPICYTTITNPVLEPSCQNICCSGCLLKWLKDCSKCPFCRNLVKTSDLVFIKEDGKERKEKEKKEDKKELVLPTKEEQVVSIIKGRNANKKYIIFSQYDDTFRPIRNALSHNNISYSEIKGNLRNINEKLDQYKSGKIQVIFLNSRYQGSGLNLIETTDIIMYHKMGREITQQVIGRALRLGRTNKLVVHHLRYDSN